MKATVKEVFIDKFTQRVYKVGEQIEIADKTRLADLVDRKLVVAEIIKTEAEKPSKTATKKKGK